MKSVDEQSFRRDSARLLLTAVTLAMCVHLPTRAQSLQVEVQQSGGGGFTAHENFSIFSSVAAPGPSGVVRIDSLRLNSGFRAFVRPASPFGNLTHIPVRPVEQGRDHTVSLDLTPKMSIESAELHYRRGGRSVLTNMQMSMNESGSLIATIPGADVTSEGVAYHIVLRDQAGRTVRSPSGSEYGVNVRVTGSGLSSTEPLPGGPEQNAYRLFSVPLILDNPSQEAVFVDELGPYEPQNWRLFELMFDQDVREYPDTRPFAPGNAFWLIVSDAQDAVSTGPGVSLIPTETYSIPLHPRWNLIGNPFNFSIPTENVTLRSGRTAAIRSFDGSWNDPIDDRVATLSPFTGYAVFNPSATVDTLDFEPLPSDQNANAGKSSSSTTRADLAWSIRVEARSGQSVDDDNVAGVSHAALSGPDPLDFPEPPSIGTFVSAYFSRPDWEQGASAYSTDIRPSSIDGGTWDLNVGSNTGDAISLTFRGIDSLPTDFTALVVDKTAEIVTDLRESPSYKIAAFGSRSTRHLQLIVGNESYTSERIDVGALPETVELSSVFPNPLRSSMTIRYGLPEPAHVTIRLFSTTGQLVQEIESSSRPKGQHAIVWEASGVPGGLANGVYLLELRANGVRSTTLVTKLH